MDAEPLVARIHIAAPPEEVFRYFTRPERLTEWMGESTDLDPRPGGIFAVDIKDVGVRGRFVELDPPNRILISWGYEGLAVLPPGGSMVEVLFTARGDGTDVELRHHGLPASQETGHTIGWDHYLSRLAIAATGREPGTDPGMPQPGDQQTNAAQGAGFDPSTASWALVRGARVAHETSKIGDEVSRDGL